MLEAGSRHDFLPKPAAENVKRSPVVPGIAVTGGNSGARSYLGLPGELTHESRTINTTGGDLSYMEQAATEGWNRRDARTKMPLLSGVQAG